MLYHLTFLKSLYKTISTGADMNYKQRKEKYLDDFIKDVDLIAAIQSASANHPESLNSFLSDVFELGVTFEKKENLETIERYEKLFKEHV